MKKFANAEIEVVKFNNAVIATSSCAAVGPQGETYIDATSGYDMIWYAEENKYEKSEM